MAKNARPTTVEVAGPATIRDIGALYDRFSLALRQSEFVKLDLAACADVDLSFVQLVYAARRQAKTIGTELSLAAPAGEALRDVLHRGGFLDAAEDRVFWLQEMEAR